MLFIKKISESFIKNEIGYLIPTFFFQFIFFGIPLLNGKVLYWGTPSLQFIPWKGLSWVILASGSIPLWNPYNGMGAPLLANYQLAFFYPPGWTLYFFYANGGYPWLAWGYTLLTSLHLCFMGVGIFFFMKRLGFQIYSASLSSLVFSSALFFIARAGFFSIIWASAWLPWILLAIEKETLAPAGEVARRKFPGELTAYIAFMLLAGHAQVSWYSLIFVFFWTLIKPFQRRVYKALKDRVVIFSIGCISSAFVTAIQLIPTIELLLNSQRAKSVEFDYALSYSLWPWQILTFLSPDFFGKPGKGDFWGYGNYWEEAVYFGFIPLILAITTFFIMWKAQIVEKFPHKKAVYFLWFSITITIVLSAGKFSPLFVFLYDYAPSFNMFNSPVRFLLITEFCFAILAGIGLERIDLLNNRVQKNFRLFTMGGFSILIITLISSRFMEVKASFSSSLMSIGGTISLLGIAVILWQTKRMHNDAYLKTFIIGFVAIELLINMNGAIPFVNMEIFDNSNNISEGNNFKLEMSRKYFDVKDEQVVKFDRIFRFRDFRPIESESSGQKSRLPNTNIYTKTSMVNNFDPLVPQRFSTWMEYLNKLPENNKTKLLGNMDVDEYIVFSPGETSGIRSIEIEPAGRLTWVSCPISVSSKTQSLMAISNFIEKNGTIDNYLVVESSGKKYDNTNCSAQPKVLKIKDENSVKIKIYVETEVAGWILLRDTFFPGWKAYQDNIKIRVYPGNYIFRAVYVSAGTHIIEFRYQPDSIIIGAFLSLTALITLVILLCRRKIVV